MTSTARRRPTPAKGDMFELTLTLPNDPIAPGAARHTLDGLGDRLPQEVVERFQIVVSELVTNALLHAPEGADIRLEARLSGVALRVAVVQPGPTFEPVIDAPHPGQESGWGLYLVSQLADRWGVVANDDVTAWCEFDLPASASSEGSPANGHRSGGAGHWRGFAA